MTRLWLSKAQVARTKCYAHNCKSMATHQVYLCSLNKPIAVCDLHDVFINLGALLAIDYQNAERKIEAYRKRRKPAK